jgi:hypothetical protein
MSTPQVAETEPAVVTAARLALDAVRAAETTRNAIYTAMAWAGQNGAVIAGWPLMQQADAILAQLVDPQGTVRALAENEVRAYEGTTS